MRANFEQNAANFEMDDIRFDAIVEMSEYDEEWVNSAIFYDWGNADDHQEWLNNAPISDVVNWVDSTIDSWV